MPVSATPYIVQHRTLLHFRMRVPVRLQACLGRKEYRRSLDTPYIRVAKPIALALAASLFQVFELADTYLAITARGGRMSDPTNPDEFLADAKIRELADRALDDGLKATREQRIRGVRSEGRLLAQLDANELLASDAMYSMAVNEPGFGLDRYKGMALGLLGECGMSGVDEAGTQFLKLCHALAAVDHVINVAAQATVFTGRLNQGQRELYEELVGVDKVATVQEVAPSNGVSIPSTSPATVKSTPLLPDMIAAYIEAKKGIDWAPRTTTDNEGILNQFVEICHEVAGAHVHIGAMRWELLRDYGRVIEKLPPHASKKRDKGATYKQIAEGNDGKRISDKRRAFIYEAVGTFLRWVKKVYSREFTIDAEGLTDALPKVKVRKKGVVHVEGDARGYSLEELGILFSADNYLGVWDAPRKGYSPERFWCPLILLFTGMRRGEVCQLRPENIRMQAGVLIFDVNVVDGKQVKTPAGRRYAPVHPFLVELGLLKYVEEIKDKASPIFPNLRVVPGVQPGEELGSWWTDYRRPLGVGGMKDDKSEVTLHALRNTFISACRVHKIDRELEKFVVGHDGADITFDYEYVTADVLYREVVLPHNFHDTIPLHPLKANPWAQKD
ncbi:phage integrase family protein [Desulfovibrio sp. A2]|nr:phage integrase family protein [Desulfovibrio sp. A2]